MRRGARCTSLSIHIAGSFRPGCRSSVLAGDHGNDRCGDDYHSQLRMIAPNGLPVKLDQDVWVTFDIDRAIFFDAGSTEYIGRFDEAAILELAASQKKEA